MLLLKDKKLSQNVMHQNINYCQKSEYSSTSFNWESDIASSSDCTYLRNRIPYSIRDDSSESGGKKENKTHS